MRKTQIDAGIVSFYFLFFNFNGQQVTLFITTALLPSHRAYPTVPQRAIVSENYWRTREERGRGLHVDSVSSRTSNTHQRTAPRRYIQKWRFSHSDNPSSSAFVNVVTIRSLELADRPGGTARRQSEEELT